MAEKKYKIACMRGGKWETFYNGTMSYNGWPGTTQMPETTQICMTIDTPYAMFVDHIREKMLFIPGQEMDLRYIVHQGARRTRIIGIILRNERHYLQFLQHVTRLPRHQSVLMTADLLTSHKLRMDETDPVNQRQSIRDVKAGSMEQKLKALLLQNPYTLELYEGEEEMGSEGEEEMGSEGGQPSGLYQWKDLKSMLHATDEELNSTLRLVSAVEVNGYWRILDDLCIGRVLYSLVWKAKALNWSLSSLDGDRFHPWGCSPAVARHCLELYASTTDGKVWELDTKRVSLELARWVLKSNGKRMELQKFMDHWSYVGLPVSLDMLKEEILVEKHGNQAWVYLLSDHKTLTSVSEAFPPDLQNPSRCDEMELDEFEQRLSLRDEDAGMMEQRLKTLLLKNPYTLAEEAGFEAGPPSRLHKWDYLKSMLYATDEELKSALRLVGAVEINGYWRIVDDLCIHAVLYQIVSGYAGFDPLDGNKIVEYLVGYCRFSRVLARHCLELYASTADGRVWELDAKRVRVELARWLIKLNDNRMEIHNFMDLWVI
ncbi:putative sister chromatid cohesion protein Dcc1 [Helianthus anomalus]